MDALNALLETPIGQQATGAVIAVLISLLFSWRGTKQMRKEVENLRKLNILTIRIIDAADLLPPGVTPTKDEAGNYTEGFTAQASLTIKSGSALSVEGEVIRGYDANARKQDPPNEEDSPR